MSSSSSWEVPPEVDRISESQWAHGLLLVGADRVNVIESLFGDLFRRRIPNLFAQMELGSELRHNRGHFITRTVLTFAALALTIAVVAALQPGARRGGCAQSAQVIRSQPRGLVVARCTPGPGAVRRRHSRTPTPCVTARG